MESAKDDDVPLNSSDVGSSGMAQDSGTIYPEKCMA